MATKTAGGLSGFAARAGLSLLAAMTGTVAHAQSKSLDISRSAPLTHAPSKWLDGNYEGDDEGSQPDAPDMGSDQAQPQNSETGDSSSDDETPTETAPQPPAGEPQSPAPSSSPNRTSE